MILTDAAAHAALLRGMQQMTALMRPTLGPVARTVAIAPIGGNGAPEVLDSAATIARRTIQLPDPFEDMGAMLVRDLALRVFEHVGDGAATAAVLAQALARAARPCVAAGCSPVALRQGIERGLEVVRAELRGRSRSIELPAEIAGVVAGSVGDPELAAMIGEIVDSVGAEGAVLFENAAGSRTSYEYVDGIRWNEGYLSYFLLKDGDSPARLLNPRILLTDQPVERAEQLLPALEACVAAGDRSLLVIAPEVRDSAVGLMVANRERGVLEGALAVKAPSFGVQQTCILEDIAAVTGGRCVHAGWHESLGGVSAEDLGRARQAWATRTSFGIVGGLGSKEQIRERITAVRAELKATDDDPHLRRKLAERLGNLSGMSAVVRVGAAAPGEQAELRLRVEAATKSAQLAVGQGVVPGGGAALLGCRSALDALELAGDQAVGVRLLACALAEPMRAILVNAGVEPEPIIRAARQRGPEWAFDVLGRTWTHAFETNLVDPLVVTLAALDAGVSTASLAISADVLVHRRSASGG